MNIPKTVLLLPVPSRICNSQASDRRKRTRSLRGIVEGRNRLGRHRGSRGGHGQGNLQAARPTQTGRQDRPSRDRRKNGREIGRRNLWGLYRWSRLQGQLQGWRNSGNHREEGFPFNQAHRTNPTLLSARNHLPEPSSLSTGKISTT